MDKHIFLNSIKLLRANKNKIKKACQVILGTNE
jgi:hypothetical protein